MSLLERLGDRVLVEDRGYSTPCWVWQRALNKGYGDGWFDGRHLLAHRWAFEATHGWVPELPMHLDHLCRVRACCNPDHVEPVTPTTNARRGAKSKLSLAQIAEILESPESNRVLAARMGVRHQTIYYYRSGGYATRKARWAA